MVYVLLPQGVTLISFWTNKIKEPGSENQGSRTKF